jgi:hypothetical protein
LQSTKGEMVNLVTAFYQYGIDQSTVVKRSRTAPIVNEQERLVIIASDLIGVAASKERYLL